MPLARIPPGSKLYYEIELLRCQQLPFGLACCPDDRYPCVSDADLDAMMQQGGGGA